MFGLPDLGSVQPAFEQKLDEREEECRCEGYVVRGDKIPSTQRRQGIEWSGNSPGGYVIAKKGCTYVPEPEPFVSTIRY